MFIGAALLFTFALASVCLAAMGVGPRALLGLLLSLCLMNAIACLIAWRFLRTKDKS